jgi:hypothetical protein
VAAPAMAQDGLPDPAAHTVWILNTTLFLVGASS